MIIRKVLQRITTSRRTREREAAAQYERVHRDGALRDDFARRTHSLEAQIARAHAENCRLRAENRALLNSVLGIAGIPPVIVADPPDLPLVGAQHAVPGAGAWRDVAHSATSQIPEIRHSDERSDAASSSRSLQKDEQPLFVSPDCPDAKLKRGPSGESGTQDDGAINGQVASNGAGSPSLVAGPACRTGGHSGGMPLSSQTRLGSTPLETDAAPPHQQLRRARPAPQPRNDAHAVAPIRRRSWHQIYRMLEFESSRRKEREP